MISVILFIVAALMLKAAIYFTTEFNTIKANDPALPSIIYGMVITWIAPGVLIGIGISRLF